MKNNELLDAILNFSYLHFCFYEFIENSSKIFDLQKIDEKSIINPENFEDENFKF